MNPKTVALKNLIVQQLEAMPEVRCRSMFGGYGLYAGERFFGIIHGERFYFHTNDESRERYVAAGMGCFITPGKQMALKKYLEVPPQVIERASELIKWAREAIGTVG